MSLDHQLHRLAEGAPTVLVDSGTYRRGRLAHRRTQAITLVTFVVLVGLVAAVGATWLVPASQRPPVADTGPVAAPGVPDQLYDVPDDLAISQDLAVGQTAAAWAGNEFDTVVLVSAVDGSYTVVHPPGYVERSPSGSAASLSPDGRLLAYPHGSAAGGVSAAVPHDLGVLDLVSGTSTVIDLSSSAGRSDGVAVDRIVWSGDSAWLAWEGSDVQIHGEGSWGGTRSLVGRSRPDGRSSTPVPIRVGGALGIDRDGTVLDLSRNTVEQWDGGSRTSTTSIPPGTRSTTVEVSADGRLASGASRSRTARSGRAVVATLRSPLPAAQPSSASSSGPGASVDSRVLGWVGDEALVSVQPTGPGGTGLTGRLDLVPADGASRTVARVDDLVVRQVMVATELMTSARPTVSRPAPEWPSTTSWRPLVLAASGAGTVAVLAVLLIAWRRRRTHA